MQNELEVRFTLNGDPILSKASPETTLLALLKRTGVNSVKQACLGGECGACTVLIDGDAVNSCLVMALTVEGRSVTTLEGVGTLENMHPLQIAFVETGASQCGFCTPGFIMSAVALLSKNPNPTIQEIREGLSGNLCRCTGYVRPVKAVEITAEAMAAGDDAVTAIKQAAEKLNAELERR